MAYELHFGPNVARREPAEEFAARKPTEDELIEADFLPHWITSPWLYIFTGGLAILICMLWPPG